MSEDKRAREERRRKIRELEASLFGASTADAFKVDLPELKKVDEYSTKFGKAERQKRYQPPTLDDYYPKKVSTSKITSKTSKKLNGGNDDRNHLLSDDDYDDDEENYNAMKSTNQVKTHFSTTKPE